MVSRYHTVVMRCPTDGMECVQLSVHTAGRLNTIKSLLRKEKLSCLVTNWSHLTFHRDGRIIRHFEICTPSIKMTILKDHPVITFWTRLFTRDVVIDSDIMYHDRNGREEQLSLWLHAESWSHYPLRDSLHDTRHHDVRHHRRHGTGGKLCQWRDAGRKSITPTKNTTEIQSPELNDQGGLDEQARIHHIESVCYGVWQL